MVQLEIWKACLLVNMGVNVYVPKDRVTNLHQGYGFVEFRSEDDADCAIKVLNMIKLYGKPIRVNKAYQDKKSLDVGANLFVGNLDLVRNLMHSNDVDEKLLYDTFSAFGVIVTNPKVVDSLSSCPTVWPMSHQQQSHAFSSQEVHLSKKGKKKKKN
ncbi:splicing factor 3B subunit 4-like [Camellia sinensis]|uniref:splicing factor 3B subunit 4-like n=1 Tax=Camellia sinensis TaxID=4442 RepID=UPI00103610AD|nr:splicing factor 3B subunit 4-like [Camellia sinensis]